MKFFNLFLFSLMFACTTKAMPYQPTETVAEDNQCTALTSCTDGQTLAGLVLPYLPAPKDGADGKDGTSVSLTDVVTAVQPYLVPGATGAAGKDGTSVNFSDVVNSVLSLMPVPTNGVNGHDGTSVSLTDVVTAVLPLLPSGPKGDPGPAGTVGASGFSNTSVLTATRVFSAAGTCTSPPCDYTGRMNVNTTTTFVPPVLNVLYGDQGVGLAYVLFEGFAKCSYTGNNKNGSALALYEFTSCVDSSGTALVLGPGVPFAFSGNVTVQLGNGSSSTSTLQVTATFQLE